MSEYINYLKEVFEPFGMISSRRMFGGYGIYYDGLMFGLVADDELFLKTDALNIEEFKSLKLEAFQYKRNGKQIKMSYFKAPEAIYDDPEQANFWASLAFEAALRTSNKKKS